MTSGASTCCGSAIDNPDFVADAIRVDDDACDDYANVCCYCNNAVFKLANRIRRYA